MTTPREYEMAQAATSSIIMMAMMTNMSIRFWAMAMQRLNPHYYAGLHPPPLPRSSSVTSPSSTSLSIIASLISSSYPNKCRTTKSPTSSFSGRGSWCCPHLRHLWPAFQGEFSLSNPDGDDEHIWTLEFRSWCHWRWWWFVARLSPKLQTALARVLDKLERK